MALAFIRKQSLDPQPFELPITQVDAPGGELRSQLA
jgi:hypothetical protein